MRPLLLPQIAAAFFRSVNRAAVSAKAFSLRLSSRSSSSMRFCRQPWPRAVVSTTDPAGHGPLGCFPGCFDFPATVLSLPMAFLRQSYSDQAEMPVSCDNSRIDRSGEDNILRTTDSLRSTAYCVTVQSPSAPTRINRRGDNNPGSGGYRAVGHVLCPCLKSFCEWLLDEIERRRELQSRRWCLLDREADVQR